MHSTYRRSRISIALMALGAALMLVAAIKTALIPDVLQYMLPAPAPVMAAGSDDDAPQYINDGVRALIEKLSGAAQELSAVASIWDLSGAGEPMTVTSDEALTESARPIAVGGRYFDLYHHPLISGRHFFDEELKAGDSVAVIDADMAFKLYGTISPLDRTLTLGDVRYRIVGVVAAGRQIGRPDGYRVYLPIAHAARTDLALTTLTLSARPMPGRGASVAFPDIARGFEAGGSFQSVHRERTHALIMARVMVFFVGLTAAVSMIRRLGMALRALFLDYIARLKREYARDMIGPLIGKTAAALVALAALVAGIFVLIDFVIEPIRVCTDWVPSNLVDWREITAVFWNIQNGQAQSLLLRTPETIRIQFFGTLSGLGVVAALAGLSLFFKRVPVTGAGDA